MQAYMKSVMPYRGVPAPVRRKACNTVGQKQAYLEWIGSIADYLQVSEHVERIASYDNYFGASPHRRIEFEFETMSDAASYWSDPVIADILANIVNHGVDSGSKVFTLRSDYTKK